MHCTLLLVQNPILQREQAQMQMTTLEWYCAQHDFASAVAAQVTHHAAGRPSNDLVAGNQIQFPIGVAVHAYIDMVTRWLGADID
ncbi:MAG: hypothetical protein RMJ96_08915 [Candidatus Bipolaricaulota bacterium]|nr:hypothetical protein [Candidatus Bipolaricaulota bacterium]